VFKKILAASGATDWNKVLTKVKDIAGGEDGLTGDEATPEDIQAVMEEYGVDENSARFMIAAAKKGYPEEDILRYVDSASAGEAPADEVANEEVVDG
jgi:hypothetical protein